MPLRFRWIAGFAILLPGLASPEATRVADHPIVTEDMLAGDDGGSINGPSLIRVPAWVKQPLGRYYLYFSHHAGKYIRLAYADRVEGPWKMQAGGVMRIEDQKVLSGHVASPDAVIEEEQHRIYLVFHGGQKSKEKDPEAGQRSIVAVSDDGLHFRSLDVDVGPAYLRIFRRDGWWYALNGRGTLMRTRELGKPFEALGIVVGPEIAATVDPLRLGEPGAPTDRPMVGADRYAIRHVGLDIVGDRLFVYFSCVGHRPERILQTSLTMKGDPAGWKASGVAEILRPEREWEGAKLPLAYSKGGRSRARENALRDPAIFVENGRRWLIYSTAGEHGLGLAELTVSK